MDSAFSIENKYKKIAFSLEEKKEGDPRSVLFYRGSKFHSFFTGDSALYFNPSDESFFKKTQKNNRKFFDSLNYRQEKIVSNYRCFRNNPDDKLYIHYQLLKKKIKRNKETIGTTSRSLIENVSIIRLWNTSMVGAVLVGMISMTVIYKYLGQEVSAENVQVSASVENKQTNDDKWDKEKEDAYINEIAFYLEDNEKNKFDDKAQAMVEGYPIENMMKYILKKDRDVAAFLIAIAKKESNWGKRVPVLDGKDCYNYWGYRGKRQRMGTGGHTCFDSRKDAVDTVAKRIKELIEKYDRNTPEEMVIWKCGSDCAATGGQAAANKWISDVDRYIKKLNTTE